MSGSIPPVSGFPVDPAGGAETLPASEPPPEAVPGAESAPGPRGGADGVTPLDLRARLTAATGGVIERPVGPEGWYRSRVFPPDGEVRREVIDFVTERNPGGVRIGLGAALPLDRVLADEGVIGVRVLARDPDARVTASIGSIDLEPFDGELVPGRQPLHGEIRLDAPEPVTLEGVEVTYKIPSRSETTDLYRFDRDVRAGEDVLIPFPEGRRGREIEQIELIWTADYNVADPSGARSDEGKPMWLDGVYADVRVVDDSGAERAVDSPKFVDEEEVDNIHDLVGVRGDALKLHFFARHPEGEDKAIRLRAVRVRYKDEEADDVTPPVRVELGRVYEPGETAEIVLPPELRDRRIGRVEVRWTDMLSGTWERPGYAEGQLEIDGEPVGGFETVQSPETQVFSYLGGLRAREGRVGVRIASDRARVDAITVYFDD